MITNVTKMVQLVLFGSWILFTPSFYSPPSPIKRIASIMVNALCGIEKNGTDELICRAGIKMQT